MADFAVNLVITRSAGKEPVPAAIGPTPSFILAATEDMVIAILAINGVCAGAAIEPVTVVPGAD